MSEREGKGNSRGVSQSGRGKSKTVRGHRSQEGIQTTQGKTQEMTMDLTAGRSSTHLKSNDSLRWRGWWRDTVSVICHYVTNHQVFRIWLLFLMILRFDRKFLCSTEFQVVSWEDYSHLESVKLEHPAQMEFNADSQLEASLGLWTRVTTCGLSMS